MKQAPFEPDLAKWDAWQPDEVFRRLAQVEAPWYVAAGWAIDLLLGGGYREHDDLEIAVPRGRLDEVLAALDGFELFAVGGGFATRIAAAGERPETRTRSGCARP